MLRGGVYSPRRFRQGIAEAAALLRKYRMSAPDVLDVIIPWVREHLVAADGNEPVRFGETEGRPLGAEGWDDVEFFISTNAGEEPRSLAKVASGGELSRIMLALKRILSRADQVATYVFDEVDAGIGGRVAEVVGRKLRALAARDQVLCVTHVPQIAALADRHFLVERGRIVDALGREELEARKESLHHFLGV